MFKFERKYLEQILVVVDILVKILIRVKLFKMLCGDRLSAYLAACLVAWALD